MANLAKKIGSFELYIDPSHAIEHINGSIILIDYSDFARRDQLIIMYNRLRDEFFGELKVNSVFRTTTSFDGRNVKELEDKLKKNLEPTLKWSAKQIIRFKNRSLGSDFFVREGKTKR